MHISNVYQPANMTRKQSAKLSPAPLHVTIQPDVNLNAHHHVSWGSDDNIPKQKTPPSPQRQLSPTQTAVLFNNPQKKIYFNKDFLETKCGFSYSSIQRIEQKEIQLEKQQMKILSQETGAKQEELIDQILVQQQEGIGYDAILKKNSSSDSLIQDEEEKPKKATEYPKEHIRHTSRQSSSWSEYKSAFSLVRVIASQWSWGELTLGLEYFASMFFFTC
jgi:hypothetical protein